MLFGEIYSQDIVERKIITEVNEVTVFSKNAQITRKKTVDLNKGECVINFTNLSPFIKPETIKVKANGAIIVLAVNHQKNYIDKPKKQKEILELETKLKDVQEKIEIENAHLEILTEELAFLKENRSIGGKNQQVSITNLKEISSFYSAKLTSLKLETLKRNRNLQKLYQLKSNIDDQLNTISNKEEHPYGEVLVKANIKQNAKVSFEISYLVKNAGWYPTYDIRAKNVKEPVELTLKANVKQNTKINWNNVHLKLSSANPNLSGRVPELKPYNLSIWKSKKKNYNPYGALEEITTEDIGSFQPNQLTIVQGIQGIQIEHKENFDVPFTAIQNQTSVDFNTEIPYSIKSDSKNYAVSLKSYSLSAKYEYYCIPKIEKDAFLIAQITDWEKYDLLEGEANIFFEDTYVGKSFLDVNNTKDTLHISLGRDKNIIVKRDKIKGYTSKKLIGTKKEEFRNWEISVKNQKSEQIDMLIYDQVPISYTNEIKVETLDFSMGNLNATTGEIKWKFTLKPKEVKKINLKYAVKYPKDEILKIE